MSRPGASVKTRLKSSVVKDTKMRNIPIMKPQSPIRFTTKAFFPAAAAEGRWYQKPIRR
jgi:hypothetical protein